MARKLHRNTRGPQLTVDNVYLVNVTEDKYLLALRADLKRYKQENLLTWLQLALRFQALSGVRISERKLREFCGTTRPSSSTFSDILIGKIELFLKGKKSHVA